MEITRTNSVDRPTLMYKSPNVGLYENGKFIYKDEILREQDYRELSASHYYDLHYDSQEEFQEYVDSFGELLLIPEWETTLYEDESHAVCGVTPARYVTIMVNACLDGELTDEKKAVIQKKIRYSRASVNRKYYGGYKVVTYWHGNAGPSDIYPFDCCEKYADDFACKINEITKNFSF